MSSATKFGMFSETFRHADMNLRIMIGQLDRMSGFVQRSATASLRRLVINRVASSELIPVGLRWRLLRILGLEVSQCRISAKNFFGSSDIHIGPGAFINRECFFDGSAEIFIESNVSVGMRAMFITSSHALDDSRRRAGTPLSKPIRIGSGAWIGAGAIVLPGISIGTGAVIAAGAIVSRDCEPHTVYAGAPARAFKSLTADEMSS